MKIRLNAQILNRLRANDATLVALHLTLNSADCQQLAEALKVNTSLKKLDLGDNNLGAIEALHLAEALKINTSLTELNLMHNNLGAIEALHLAEALKINTSLKELNLESNNLGEIGALHLLEALEVNTSLQKLNLRWNNLGESGALYLAEALKVNTSLEKLDIWGNYLGEGGALHLAEALKVNTSLKVLDIRWNNFGERGALHVAEALKVNTSLKELNLWGNNIGESGAMHLSEGLKVNTSLEVLNIGGNIIGEGGAWPLAEALTVNNCLQKLDISWNNLGESDALSLAEALKVNTRLKELALYRNNLGESGARHLAKALLENYNLLSLDGVDNLRISNYLNRNCAIHNAIKNLNLAQGSSAINLEDVNNTVTSLQSIILEYSINLASEENIVTESLRLLYALGCALGGSKNPEADALVALEKEFSYLPYQKIADELICNALMNLADSLIESAQDLLMRALWLYASTKDNQAMVEHHYAVIILYKLQELKKEVEDLDLTKIESSSYLPKVAELNAATPKIDLSNEIFLTNANHAKSSIVDCLKHKGVKPYSVAFFSQITQAVDHEEVKSIHRYNIL